jgi:hypothetical protein
VELVAEEDRSWFLVHTEEAFNGHQQSAGSLVDETEDPTTNAASGLIAVGSLERDMAGWNDGDLIRRADESAFHYLASSTSTDDIGRLLLSAANLPDKQGSLPIHVAAGQGRLGIIDLLLDECPHSLWSRSSSGQTFLHVAVYNVCSGGCLQSVRQNIQDHSKCKGGSRWKHDSTPGSA